MTTIKNVEIYSIGDELLQGEVDDANTPWLCRRLSALGARVIRTVQLREEREAVVHELRRFIAGDGDLLITTGGIGLCDNEKMTSFAAVAFERPFEINDEALRMVQRRYEELADQHAVTSTRMNESRRKMAYLPRGAKPLENLVGLAPGMLMSWPKGTIVSLPANHDEMRSIFEGSLSPHLPTLLPNASIHQEIVRVSVPDETLLIPAMRHVRERHDVSIKSRTQREKDGLYLRIVVSAYGTDDDHVAGRVERAIAELRDELAEEARKAPIVVENVESKVAKAAGVARELATAAAAHPRAELTADDLPPAAAQ
jgi:molybdopterin-biosynthesis enzyme MoeA-like protein